MIRMIIFHLKIAMHKATKANFEKSIGLSETELYLLKAHTCTVFIRIEAPGAKTKF